MKNSIDFQEVLLKDSKETIWIGVDNEDDFTNHIPNFYEFKHNKTRQTQIKSDFRKVRTSKEFEISKRYRFINIYI